MKIEDIARLAGVSKSAVSLALNNKPGISEETRKEILALVQEYHYVPQRKRKKKPQATESKTIRLLAYKNDDIITANYQHQPFFSQLIAQLSEEAHHFQYALLLSSITADNFEESLLQLEKEKPVAGTILLGTNLSAAQIEKISAIVPNLLILDNCFLELNQNFISINNYQGAYAATNYLLENEHQRIGYVQATSRITNFEERKRGFLAALTKKQLPVDAKDFLSFPSTTMAAHTAEFLQAYPTGNYPTAFFCENDYLAISLIKTLQALEIAVPEEVSVIGFDHISEGEVIAPSLATVAVFQNEISRLSLTTLTEIINQQKAAPTAIFVNTEIIKGASVQKRKKL